MSELAQRLDRAAPVRAARSALAGGGELWIVGGAVRDAALGREVVDLDLVVGEGEEEKVARRLARAAGGSAFPLSERFGTWRVVGPDRSWWIDLVRMRGGGIDEDLAARDFTINAVAMPLAGGELRDPHRGIADLESRRLRAVGQRSFADDPLRLLRAVRLASELELDLEPSTLSLARDASARAAEPAGERQFSELRRIVAGPAPLRGLALMDEIAITAAVLPELEALRGVEQNPYHHLDCHGHTLAVLEETVAMEGRLSELFGEHAGDVAGAMAQPLADELTRTGALRFGALVHDFGKPRTRTVNEEGRILFLGHDRAGAEIVADVCRRLRTSRKLSTHLQGLTLNHLRLGFLVHARPLSRRQVYDYLAATDPASLDVTLLTVADRLATQGPKTRSEALESHLELAREMVGEALAWARSGPPRPPVDGSALAEELGIERGAELGRLLGELAAATFAGEVATREQALELARRLQADTNNPPGSDPG